MLPQLTATIGGKVLSAIAVKAQKAYLEEAERTLQEAIRRKISSGKVYSIMEDRAAGAIFQYYWAALEGVARENLRLMAEAFANAAIEPTFEPAQNRVRFRILAELTPDELIVLGRILRVLHDRGGVVPEDTDARLDLSRQIGKKLREEYCGPHLRYSGFDALQQHLLTLQGRGLLIPIALISGDIFYPSPLLIELARYAPLASQDP